MQFGLDMMAKEWSDGLLIIGTNASIGGAYADVDSGFGNGDANTTAYAAGLTATWYGKSGFYADAQGQFNWFESTLKSDSLGKIVSNNKGHGYALSLEVGQRIEGDAGIWSLTPQAQLEYSDNTFDSFTGPFGEKVKPGSMDKLKLRLGVSADRQEAVLQENGKTSRNHLYGIVNAHVNLLGKQSVNVSGTNLSTKQDDVWAEVGVGANHSWDDDKYAFYGEVSARTGVDHPFDSYALEGTVGFRIRF